MINNVFERFNLSEIVLYNCSPYLLENSKCQIFQLFL